MLKCGDKYISVLKDYFWEERMVVKDGWSKGLLLFFLSFLVIVLVRFN